MDGMLYSTLAILTNYRIMRIEEEQTPLASSAPSVYYGDMIAGMLVVGLLLIITAYIILCAKYRKRIIELRGDAKPGWNWWKLRKQATELEDQKAEGIVEDIKRAAENYMTV